MFVTVNISFHWFQGQKPEISWKTPWNVNKMEREDAITYCGKECHLFAYVSLMSHWAFEITCIVQGRKPFFLHAEIQMIYSKHHPTQKINHIQMIQWMSCEKKKTTTPKCIAAMWFSWQELIKSAFPMECRCWRHTSTRCACMCLSLSLSLDYSIKQRKGGLKDSWAQPTRWERN